MGTEHKPHFELHQRVQGELARRVKAQLWMGMGSSGSSVDKESAFNAGDPSLIPGLGRSPGKGIGYPLWCLWASLVAQMVRNLPAMRDIWV